MTPQLKMLVIEDEVQLRRLLRLVLQSKCHEIFEADTGVEGLRVAALKRPDVILLDLGLPDIDGLEVLQRLREWTDTPILVLSVLDKEEVKVAALEQGADDYVTKPFSTPELLARLSALLRRNRRDEEALVSLGALKLDWARREVTLHGDSLKLTPIEFALFRLLARNAGRILIQKRILLEIWGPNAAEQAQYLRVHITHLRKKLDGSGVEIRNEPGIGYRLVVV